MIEFNKILNPRLVAWLVRVFAMKIGGSPAPTLAPEVAPSIDVNQQDDPTLRFIRGERLMSATFNLAPSVGNINKLQVRNPANSGVVVVITSISVASSGGVFDGVGVSTTDLVTFVTPQPRDSRWFAVGGTRGASLVSWSQTAAPTSPQQYITVPNSTGLMTREIVVPPGSAYQAQQDTANLQLLYSVQYLERPIAAEELSTG